MSACQFGAALGGGAALSGTANAGCRPSGHAIEPVRRARRPLNAPCPAQEHQKRRLERILGIRGITQNTTAHAHDHVSMAAHDRGERTLIPGGGIALQELEVSSTALPRPLCEMPFADKKIPDHADCHEKRENNRKAAVTT